MASRHMWVQQPLDICYLCFIKMKILFLLQQRHIHYVHCFDGVFQIRLVGHVT